MHVPGDLMRGRATSWRMPQRDARELDLVAHPAAKRAGSASVVIAAEPDPLTILLQDCEPLAIIGANAARGALIVEAVAERNDPTRLVAVDHLRQPDQGLTGVVGGQQSPRLRSG